MISYSIKQLEKISGIKAHTIRIWEKRYNLFSPARTGTNIRYYDNTHLKKILNISTLLNNGYKISKIGELADQEVFSEIYKIYEANATTVDKYTVYVNQLIAISMEFNQAGFEKIFNSCVLKYGFPAVVENILYPLFNRVGILWQSSKINPAQEHFISNIARQKFFSAIDSIPGSTIAKGNCLLFLPEHEEHEIGLLYCNYLLLSSGYQTTYLGQRLPFENLADAVKFINPSHLVLFLVTQIPGKDAQKYITALSAEFPDTQIVICGGSMLLKLAKPPSNITLVKSPADFKTAMQIKHTV